MFFVKQLVSPKYPVDGAPGSAAKKREAMKKCEAFEASQRRIQSSIRHKVASGGSIVAPVEFGRAGTTYYKIYDRIDVANLTPAQIAALTTDGKLLILRVVAHSLSILHKERIVHGDLKPPNILIKVSETRSFTSKLIDFDDSYFDGEPPEDAELVIGDPAYYSPELLDYVMTCDTKKRSNITTKSDIFALGVIFTEYWSGNLPGYNKSKFGSCAATVLAGEELTLGGLSIPIDIATLIQQMVRLNPKERPLAIEVLSSLKTVKCGGVEPSPTIAKPIEPSRLLGKRPTMVSPAERLGRGADADKRGSVSPTVPKPGGSRLMGKPKS
jgi:serine/threonine protein kinase